jgi:hypothetical protein
VRLQKLSSKSSMPWHCQIATKLVFAWCGCNLVKIQVIATSFTVWLQPLMCCDCKKDSCKTRMWVIATLSQCDCTLIAVWLRLQKTGKKCDCNKHVKKKAPCHYTVRLRLGLYLLDVVASWWKYGWLQNKLKCGCNHWCAAIVKKGCC